MSPHEGQLFAPIISPPLRDNLGRAGTHQMDPGFASSKLYKYHPGIGDTNTNALVSAIAICLNYGSVILATTKIQKIIQS